MSFEAMLDTFVAESRELLRDMESELLKLERDEPTPEAINAIFRAAHTIKGSAGMFGLEPIVSFTHIVETVLDRVRSQRLTLTTALAALLLDCKDQLASLIEALASGDDQFTDFAERSSELAAALRSAMGEDAAVGMPPADSASRAAASPAPVPSTTPTAVSEELLTGSEAWHISVRYRPQILHTGVDPLSILRYLTSFGELLGVQVVDDALPPADRFDPEACYLGFELRFRSQIDKAQIENAFEFAWDDCSLTILPPRSRIADYIRLLRDLPESDARLGELLVQCGSLTSDELAKALREQQQLAAASPGAAPQLGELLVQQKRVQAPVVEAALEKQRQTKERAKDKGAEKRTLRVDADKLDYLIDRVGELIIAGATTAVIAHRMRLSELSEAVSHLSRLVEDVRDQALQLRMLPIGETFSRFQRIVRDVARELGKDIRLEISGGDTELDKTLIEQIADPLTHLVRNAVDHGIESAERRAAAGKDLQGVVRLHAMHESGAVIIEVADDGGGLPYEKILAKAQAKGLIAPGQILSEREVYALIFEPGFSTAEQVTNLSGRGVGMDVVRRNINNLRGSIDIHSESGRGTVMRIRLPLTLAIIEGFHVRVGRSSFVIPLDLVEECIEFANAEHFAGGHRYFDLRGKALPFVRLRELFGIPETAVRRESLVVIRCAGQRAGLVVDDLLGEMQAVIKPLAPIFSHLRGISGSTILGDGSVALILDVMALLQVVASTAPTEEPVPA